MPGCTVKARANGQQAKAREKNRTIGVYPETKHPTFHQDLGLPLQDKLLAALSKAGWNSAEAPVFKAPGAQLRQRPGEGIRAVLPARRERLVQRFPRQRGGGARRLLSRARQVTRPAARPARAAAQPAGGDGAPVGTEAILMAVHMK